MHVTSLEAVVTQSYFKIRFGQQRHKCIQLNQLLLYAFL
jgi:hypothetical protein